MKNNTELWILPHEDIAKGLLPAWESAIVETLNGLIEYEAPLRTYQFQKDTGSIKKQHLIDFVREGSYLLVLEHKKTNDVIGTVLVQPVKSVDHMVGLFGFLYINPQYRRKGYAEHLMQQAESISKKMGCSEIHLAVLSNNEHARAFYDAMNYEPTQVYLAKRI
jgi:Acetyltransferases